MKHSLVYVTTPDMTEAEKLATMVVEKRLAACANILPKMKSVYRWQGKVETAQEVVVIIKTRTELVEKLIFALAKAHSYEVPCVVSWPISEGHQPFLDWIFDETS